jgi:hypothetical protein
MYSKLSLPTAEGKKKAVDQQFVPQDFLSIGINLLKSIQQLVRVEQQLQKELAQTNGWLRKKMLDNLTGKTARQRIEEEKLLEKQNEYHKISKISTLFEKEAQKKIASVGLRSSRGGQSSAQVSFKIKRS